MSNYLVFQLYGSLAAWGEPAVGGVRHTNSVPSRSALLGLLAAALGIRREEEERLQQFNQHYQVAVRVVSQSNWLRDYHTTQVPKENRKLNYITRRDELTLAPSELETMLSVREYRADSYYLIAIEATETAPYSLEEIKEALLQPVYPLYLGRKSCPLGLPLAPRCLQGILAQVFSESESLLLPELKPRQGWGRLCYWEGQADIEGIKLQLTKLRTDQSLSRKRWQFGNRIQHQGLLVGEQ